MTSLTPINAAYSDAELDFHMDLSHYESPPGLQFLHCLRFDDCVTGGETVFVDVWHVAETLRATCPNYFDTLTRVPATFQKMHFDRQHPVYMRYRLDLLCSKQCVITGFYTLDLSINGVAAGARAPIVIGRVMATLEIREENMGDGR